MKKNFGHPTKLMLDMCEQCMSKHNFDMHQALIDLSDVGVRYAAYNVFENGFSVRCAAKWPKKSFAENRRTMEADGANFSFMCAYGGQAMDRHWRQALSFENAQIVIDETCPYFMEQMIASGNKEEKHSAGEEATEANSKEQQP